MSKDDKLKDLKDRIQTAETTNSDQTLNKKVMGLDLASKLVLKL